MTKINGMGLICPIPMIMTKKALASIKHGTIEVLVDNKTAQENIEKLSTELKCSFSSSKENDDTFKIIIEKSENNDITNNIKEKKSNDIIIVIDSDEMGTGDSELGKILIQNFIYSLSEMDILPKSILLYNKGVFLASNNKNTILDLKTLENLGVEILSCGACLNYYGLQDKLQVGIVGNMYSIINKQLKADKIIKI